MKGIRYPAEFKAEAIKQISESGQNTADVADRLGMSTKSVYKCIKEAEIQNCVTELHDPLTWQQDLNRRVKEMQLGER